MDTKWAFLDHLLDLGDSGTSRIDRLQRTSRPESAPQDGEDDRMEEGKIGAVERAVDEDRFPRGQASARLRLGLATLRGTNGLVQFAQREALRLEVGARDKQPFLGPPEILASRSGALRPLAGSF